MANVSLALTTRAWPCDASEAADAVLSTRIGKAIVRRLRSPSDVAATGASIARIFDGPCVKLDIRRLGAVGAIASLTFGRVGSRLADVQFLSMSKTDDGWEMVGAFAKPTVGEYTLFASSLKGAMVAFLYEFEGSQATSAALELRDARFALQGRVGGIVDPTYIEHDSVTTMRWSRPPRHFDADVDGRCMIHEDVVLDLDRAVPDVVSRVSMTPWLDALDAACDHPQAGMPCEGTLVTDRHARLGIELQVGLSPVSPLTCVSARNAPTVVALYPGAVITMNYAPSGWAVTQVRPSDRRCAVYGFRLMAVAPPKPNNEGPRLTDWARTLVVVPGDRLLIGMRNEVAMTGESGGSTTIAQTDESLDVAFVDGRALWLDDGGLIRFSLGGRVSTLTRDPDAAGISQCGPDVCWSAYEAGEVRRLRHGKIDVVSSGLKDPFGLAWTGQQLVVATDDGLVAVPLDDSPPMAVPEAFSPVDVASNRSRLAWIEAGGQIVVISTTTGASGCTESTTGIFEVGGRPASIALTDQEIFWVDAVDGLVRREPCS